MRIAFYLENKNIPDVDLSRPDQGNPGCGATQFLLAALPFYLAALRSDAMHPVLLANHTTHLPPTLEAHQAGDILDAARMAKTMGCAFFIYRPRISEETGLHALLHQLALPSIAWLHLTPSNPHTRTLGANPYIKAVVCVGPEQHEALRDTRVMHKLTYIVNGVDGDFYASGYMERDPHLVVYLGAMVPQKGFHLLAEAWPRVLRRHPDARLAVIGSGALYKAEAKLGSWGIAEESYEERSIKPHLRGPDGKPHLSVQFLGKLGIEKMDLLRKAAVGVVNPSGQTETSCVSALEFQACATPVVSGAFYALLDTVCHRETGLLGRTLDDLAENICRLLADGNLARRLGENGAAFVRDQHNFSGITQQWVELFIRLAEGKKPSPVPRKTNIHRHAKWLVYINQPLQATIGHCLWWPSTLELKELVKAALKKTGLRKKA
jgi:glycosyltransferase involved in cell wall biosynthesis